MYTEIYIIFHGCRSLPYIHSTVLHTWHIDSQVSLTFPKKHSIYFFKKKKGHSICGWPLCYTCTYIVGWNFYMGLFINFCLMLSSWKSDSQLIFDDVVIIISWHVFTPVLTDDFHWSPNDNKSSQLSRTLLSILANLNSPVIWSILPWIFIFLCLFSIFFGSVPRVPTMISITVNFMFLNFLSSVAKFRYLFSFSFSFTCELLKW